MLNWSIVLSGVLTLKKYHLVQPFVYVSLCKIKLYFLLPTLWTVYKFPHSKFESKWIGPLENSLVPIYFGDAKFYPLGV